MNFYIYIYMPYLHSFTPEGVSTRHDKSFEILTLVYVIEREAIYIYIYRVAKVTLKMTESDCATRLQYQS